MHASSISAQTTTDGWSVSPGHQPCGGVVAVNGFPLNPGRKAGSSAACKHPAEAQACRCGGFVLCPGGERGRGARTTEPWGIGEVGKGWPNCSDLSLQPCRSCLVWWWWWWRASEESRDHHHHPPARSTAPHSMRL